LDTLLFQRSAVYRRIRDYAASARDKKKETTMFTCVRNGKPVGTIHIPSWSAEHEAFAAAELSKYMARITGVGLPVTRGLKRTKAGAIVVADLSHPAAPALLPKGVGDGLKHDGCRIKTVGNRLYIVSREPGGVVFGVYKYLSRLCGCAFLDYADKGETIPRTDTIRHDSVDIVDNPACWYRGMQTRSDEVDIGRRIDWMAKNGFSHLLVHTTKDREAVRGRMAQMMPLLRERGMKLAMGHHIFSRLIDGEKFHPERPDFYTKVKGKRTVSGQLKFCLSNRDLIDTFSREVIGLIRENPEADTVQIWPDDGRGKGCECRDCTKLVHPSDGRDTDRENLSGRGKGGLGRRGDRAKMRKYLHLANEVAARVAEVYPKVKLSVLAYANLADPPLADVYVHPNLIVCLALYWRCSKHKLTDPKCPINRQYVGCIQDWLKVVKPGSLYFYSYEMGMGCWHSLPYPILTNLFAEWPWLKKLGVGGTHIQSATKHMGVYGMNYGAVARLLREECPTLDGYIKDYCEAYYGPAAKPMISFCRKLEKCMQNARTADVRPGPLLSITKVFSVKDIDACRALCGRAMGLTSDPVQRWRVERMRSQMDYVQLYRSAPAAMLRYLETGRITGAEKKRVAAWIEKVRRLVQEHLDLDDDMFMANFAVKMRSGYLGEI